MAERLSKAEALLARKEYRDAHAICLEVLREAPESAGAWFLLGVIAADHGNVVKGEELFAQAAALDPRDPRPLAHRGRCLIALNAPVEAIAAAEAAAALKPRDALTLDTVGVVLSRAGRQAQAAPFFKAAVAAAPRNPDFRYNLGAALQFVGDLEGAEAAYAAALELQPDMHRAWSSRVALRRQTLALNHRAQLEQLFADGPANADRDLHLGHALAKTCEDLGDFPAALDWLKRGKARRRAELGSSTPRDEALLEAAAGARPAAPATQVEGSDAPIFIVGLPRTGTTLVDRILSSHPDVESLGELTQFGLAVKRIAGTPSPLALDAETLTAARDADPAAIGRAYLDSVSPLRTGVPRFVDKMPLNVLYAGLVGAALPGARIVCLRRDPMDSCLSNYRQLFASGFGYYDYAYDLEDAGRYYLLFDRLVAHWRSVLPADRFLEVGYEDIVHDQERTTRGLLTFAGLTWDDRCLAFHENEAPVATASFAQVRQPLYASSIGRWRRYGEGLAPLRRVLQAGGVPVS